MNNPKHEHLSFDQLYGYPSGEASDKTIERHLNDCKSCNEQYNKIQDVNSMLLKAATRQTQEKAYEKGPNCPDEKLLTDYTLSVILKVPDYHVTECTIK